MHLFKALKNLWFFCPYCYLSHYNQIYRSHGFVLMLSNLWGAKLCAMPHCVKNRVPVFCMPVACSVVTDAAAFYVSLLIFVSHFFFVCWRYVSMLVRPGVKSFAQCLGTLCVSCLRSVSRIMWKKKSCLGVLYIELVIMYKLFLPCVH
jgi:hypothetical protein